MPNSASHAVVHARVVSVQPRHVNLDREWEGSRQIPFDYLTVATGTLLSQPAAMRKDDKQSSVEYLKQHQEAIKQAKSILLVGGGAVGVQMATDLKEYYPDKDVTLVHSRVHLMPQYHHKFHDLVKKRFDELHVNLITGARVRIPPQGFPTNGSPFEVQLTNGQKVTTEFVILATGQSPNNSLVRDLEPENPNAVINPENGYIRVRSTLQFLDDKYPNLFAVGDIADSGAHKAARPGVAQAAVVAKNVQSLIEGRQAEEKYVPGPAGIHLSLGMVGWGPLGGNGAAWTDNLYRRRMSFSGIRTRQKERRSQRSCLRASESYPDSPLCHVPLEADGMAAVKKTWV